MIWRQCPREQECGTCYSIDGGPHASQIKLIHFYWHIQNLLSSMWSNSFFPLNPKCRCTEQQVKNTDEIFRMQNLQSPAGSINNFWKQATQLFSLDTLVRGKQEKWPVFSVSAYDQNQLWKTEKGMKWHWLTLQFWRLSTSESSDTQGYESWDMVDTALLPSVSQTSFYHGKGQLIQGG